MCPHCAISLTYHKAEQKLKCHYCEYTMDMPQQCPKCGSQFIRYFGSGTQLVEEAIKVKWPWINILRMDLDTTQNKNAHQEILSSFANGQAQVLIGTQMVTKGLDFPNVTLVGVIAADLTLNMPDYSASERTFQLLTQVAGRAGRGERLGQVIVQTYTPDHYSLLTGRDHDYLSFYHMEIKNRELMQYPPFMYLVRILFSDFKTQEIEVLMEQAADYLIQMYPDVHLLGPAEAPIKMIRNRWRYHMVLKHSDLTYLINCAKDLQSLMNVSRKSKTLRIIVDVEPQSIL